MNDSPKHKRHWYQISLKWLMIGVTLFCVTVGSAVGWIRYRQQQARENRERVAAVEEAVEEIEEMGGKVVSAYEKLRPQTWLEELFDDPGDANDPVGVLRAYFVDLRSTKVTDSDLRHLTELTSLEGVALGSANVTDAGLEHLKGLTNLKHLSFHKGTKFTDAGLAHLKGLTNLETLLLGKTNVTAAGLEHLKGLTKLEVLHLYNNNITDDGLEHLKGLTKLKHLDLDSTNVTEEGVKKLQQSLPNCEIER